MTARRYAILDKNGVKINTILIDDPIPESYWPGYGSYLVDETGSGTAKVGKVPPKLTLLSITPNKTLVTGDTVNITTGNVTKRVPPKDEFNSDIPFDANYTVLCVKSKTDLGL